MSDTSSAAAAATELEFYKAMQAGHDDIVFALRTCVATIGKKNIEIVDLQRQLDALQPTPQSDPMLSAHTNVISKTGKRNWLLPQ